MSNKELTFGEKVNKIQTDLKVLLDEVDSFLTDYELQEIRNDIYIAGGAIRDVYHNYCLEIIKESFPNSKRVEYKDIDIFFKTDKYINLVKEKLKDSGFISNNAVTHGKMQFVTKFIGSPEEVISQFDFTVNMCFYDIRTEHLHIEQMFHIIDHKLAINPHCRNKLGTLIKIPRMLDKGYRLDTESLKRLGVQLTRLDPVNTIGEFHEQSGIYVSSFDYDTYSEYLETENIDYQHFKELHGIGDGYGE